MGLFLVAGFLLVCVFGICVYKIFFMVWPQVAITKNQTTNITKKPIEINWPKQAQSAISAVGSPVIFESDHQAQPKPTASVAKLMTALAVLKKHPLKLGQSGPTITIKSQDVSIYNSYLNKNGSVINVVTGQNITEYQALQAILLPSANNMADSLAIWAYGSLDNYSVAANKLAKSLDMHQSHFADDASGFSPNTVSTPHDLILLGKAALKNSIIKHITSKKIVKLPNGTVLNNTNKLLGSNGFIGLKTGNTLQAGYCLLFANTKIINGHKVTLIGSVNGQDSMPQVFDSSTKLASSGYQNLRIITVAKQDQILLKYSPAWQNNVYSVASKNLSIPAWNNEIPSVKSLPINFIRYQPIDKISGSLIVKDSFGANSTSLYLQNPINQPAISWRLIH